MDRQISMRPKENFEESGDPPVTITANGGTIKDKLKSSLSDPNPRGSITPETKVLIAPSGSDRRARWLRDKIRFHHASVHEDSDFHDQLESQTVPQFRRSSQEESHLTRRYDPVNAKYRWRRRGGGGPSQTPSPLPPIKSSENISEAENNKFKESQGFGLSRQNGVRFSLRTRRSRSRSPPCSISSESEVSQKDLPSHTTKSTHYDCLVNVITQGDCDNSHDPSAKLKTNSGDQDQTTGQRKQSVFFSSYGVWSEESVMKSFRDLSPDISSLLEAAWSGQVGTMEDILRDPNFDIECRDAKGRTALHLAAAGGHAGAVELLLQKGARVDPCDSFENATPLMCAAAAGSMASVEILLSAGADFNAGYDSGKTPLHWAVQAGSLECAKKLLEKGAKQNPPLVYSENPLHIAASLGEVGCLQLLLDYGADVSLCRGTNRSTVLHIAAEEGNSGCIRVLLKASACKEAADSRGHTALHVAATVDAECTSILLASGANPNALDKDGRTPLHSAISRGTRAAECVRLLVENQAEINCQDNFGYTPLHLAAVNESSSCTSILLHHGADVTMKTKAGTTALSLLVRRIPDVMRYLVDRLDSAVTIHDHDPGDPDCEVRLDFRAVVPNSDKRVRGSNKKFAEREYYHKPRKETEFLTCVLAAGNKKILNHPLSEAFLTLKWQRVRKFFWASLLFQVALVILFTVFVVNIYLINCPHERYTHNETDTNGHNEPRDSEPTSLPPPIISRNSSIRDNITFIPPAPDPSQSNSSTQQPKYRIKRSSNFVPFSFNPTRRPQNKGKSILAPTGSTKKPLVAISFRIGQKSSGSSENSKADSKDESEVGIESKKMEDNVRVCGPMVTWLSVIWCMLIAFTALMAVKETFQLLQAPRSYVVSSENWGQWALIISVLSAAWPASIPILYINDWQYPAAAFGMLLAWGLMLLQVGRFPALGLYVQMLGKVAANFSIVILAYACLLIAFALAFCVIFPGLRAYGSIPLAILKVLTMMVGEVDYEEVFYNEDDEIPYPITSHLLHGAFVIIVTIILMNLLVGLAVSDIQGLQKGAKLNRLSRQTALISRLESFIFSKRLQGILPHSVGLILQRSALLVPSSYNWSYYFRPNDPRDKRLSKELKHSALRLASARQSARHESRVKKLNNYDHDYHTTFNNNNIVPHISSTDASLKRMEQRLEKLQDQIDLILHQISSQMEIIREMNEGNSPATQPIHT